MTTFPVHSPGDKILDSDVEVFNTPINNLETGAAYYGAASGGTNAFAVTIPSGPASYSAGMIVHFKANAGNTGAATLSVNGMAAKTIKKKGSQDLVTGDILSGQMIAVLYDGVNFQLVSESSTQPGDLPSGIDAAKIGAGTVSNTEFGYLDGVTSALQTQLNGKAATTHTHAAADITSGTFGTSRIANSAITYAKIQNVSATDKLLGRATGGAGVVEEITCTPFARTLLDDGSAGAALSTLGAAAASHTHSAADLTSGTVPAARLAAHSCSVTRNSADMTGIASGTDTPLAFDFEDFDTDGFHVTGAGNTKFTVPSGLAGKYLFWATAFISGNAGSNSNITVSLFPTKNVTADYIWSGTGNGYVYVRNQVFGTFSVWIPITFIVNLAVGDYIEINVSHNIPSGGTVDASGHAGMVYLGA